MEILRFEESETPAPKRKRASKGWVALGLVASLMGVSTAFASSTININGNNLSSLGQGVSNVVGCDNEVGVTPESSVTIVDSDLGAGVNNVPGFQLSSVSISGIDLHEKLVEDPNIGKGCGGSVFELQVFKKTGIDPVGLSCEELFGAHEVAEFVVNGDGWGAKADCINVESSSGSIGAIYFDIAKVNTLTSGTDVHDLALHTNGTVTISGMKWVGDVSYMTLVSLESHDFSDGHESEYEIERS